MWSVKEVIYGCIRGLDEIQQSMIHDVRIRHNSGSKQGKMHNSCCHHSLKNLCGHTDGAWWKMKKYSHKKHWELSRWVYPLSEVLFCWMSVSNEKGNTDHENGGTWRWQRNNWMHCVFLAGFLTFWSNLITLFVLLCCMSQSIFSWSRGHIPINESK